MLGLLLAVAAAPTAHAQWTVTNLHPPGVSKSFVNAIADGQQVGFTRSLDGTRDSAALWSGTAASWINLQPDGATQDTEAYGVSGGQQVGSNSSLWNGSAASRIDLNPILFYVENPPNPRIPVYADTCQVRGISGGQQVGNAWYGSSFIAGMWTGTAGSWVNLNPMGSVDSIAYGVGDGQQVGFAGVGAQTHASLWSGSVASWIDLHPTGATRSVAYSASAGQQVGIAEFGAPYPRASLWTGTAASWIDITPPAATEASVACVYQGIQVGAAKVNGKSHAVLWNGTAESWEDLGQAEGLVGYSTGASGVWSDANTIYVVGTKSDSGGNAEALLWTRPRSSNFLAWYQFEAGPVGQPAGTVATSWGRAALNGTASGSGGWIPPTYSWDVHGSMPCTGSGTGGAFSLAFSGTATGGQQVAFAGPFPFNTPGDVTVSFWMKSPFAQHGAILWGNADGADTNRFQIYVNTDGTLGLDYREPNGAIHCLNWSCAGAASYPIPVNQWTHVMIARQGAAYRFYRNGTLVSTAFDVNTNLPTSIGWGIGSRPCCCYNGLIDDLRFYSGAIAPGDLEPIPASVAQPSTVTRCPTGSAALSVPAGCPGYTYQWQVQTAPGVWTNLAATASPLPCSATALASATPANSPSVTIGLRPCSGIAGSPQYFQLRCVVSNASGSATSGEATYTICPADIDCSGALAVADIFAFLNRWFEGNPNAEFDGINGLQVADIFAFLNAWFAGC